LKGIVATVKISVKEDGIERNQTNYVRAEGVIPRS